MPALIRVPLTTILSPYGNLLGGNLGAMIIPDYTFIEACAHKSLLDLTGNRKLDVDIRFSGGEIPSSIYGTNGIIEDRSGLDAVRGDRTFVSGFGFSLRHSDERSHACERRFSGMFSVE
jgi:hypothetical protein